MTAALGKLLLFLGCTALGLGRGFGLKRRTACLFELRRALEALGRELSFSLRPLGGLLDQAQRESRGEASQLFAACREAAERAAEELLLRGAAGVPVDGLSMGETEYLEAEGLYRLAVRCRCGAWIAAWAVEDGGRLTDFEVRGTMR